ncbi:MAG TPA: hypothetical protein VFT60_14615 [Bryobacteraceae bacterium]|nr:hypothetical protein [Bryobacteraceae bacterium]
MPLTYDKATDAFTCPVHGEDVEIAWVPCYAGCDEGYFDAYDDDPINEDPGTFERCGECRGKGGFTVCAECNIDNPDAEF